MAINGFCPIIFENLLSSLVKPIKKQNLNVCALLCVP